MALSKSQKVSVLQKFENIVATSPSLVFLQVTGVPVTEVDTLRIQLRNAQGGYVVAKKTLFKKALSGSSITGDMPELAGGELAVAFASDVIAPAREVFNFKKRFANNITVVGGVFEGKYITSAEAQAIAEIPGTDVLRGMFVNVINSPIQGLVIALNQIAEKKTA